MTESQQKIIDRALDRGTVVASMYRCTEHGKQFPAGTLLVDHLRMDHPELREGKSAT